MEELGTRLDGTTKETLDVDSDYFKLVQKNDEQVKIIANTFGKPEVTFKAIKLEIGNDWCVSDADNYAEAHLVSVDQEVDTTIVRAFEKQHGLAMYCNPIHFDPAQMVPGFPRDAVAPPLTPGIAAGSAAGGEMFMTPLKEGLKIPE